MLQEIGIWVMFFVMTVMVTGIIGDRGVIYKLLTLLAIHCIWNCSLCDLYLAAVQIFCDLYGIFLLYDRSYV